MDKVADAVFELIQDLIDLELSFAVNGNRAVQREPAVNTVHLEPQIREADGSAPNRQLGAFRPLDICNFGGFAKSFHEFQTPHRVQRPKTISALPR